MSQVNMPRLSDSMEEGTIVRWLKSNGEEVKRGEEIVEIETDKATMAYESDFSGTLTIVVEEGASVPVGALIGEVGNGAAAGPKPTDAAVAPPAAAATEVVSPQQRASSVESADGPRGVKASPLARRTAQSSGVDLAGVSGSGPYGRILKVDVIAALAAAPSSAPATRLELAVAPPQAPGSTQSLSRTQALIARRMTQSRAEVPEFSLEVDVDMAGALRLRNELKVAMDPPPSLNDIIVMASSRALLEHPLANGSFGDDGFVLHEQVNVAIAVAAEQSLVVPVLRNTDRLSLGAIAVESRRLIERVRSGTIAPAELEGGTFTVSNLGMFGIDRFEGIINAPQSAILCVGAARERAVVDAGEVVVRTVATLTLACDHRILYGADAARFLAYLRLLLEQPVRMLL